tara:strand:- start:393 stop:779 length:387 start_codon:yes stop_codon:yes gene_type:complete
MLTTQEINTLGQICNSTWGRAGELNSRVPTESFKMNIQGNKMTCTYTTIVNLVNDRNLRDQARRCEEESIKLMKDYIKNIKSEFKDIEGRPLQAKEIDTSDSIEIITVSPYNPKRTAYYRRFTTYEIN